MRAGQGLSYESTARSSVPQPTGAMNAVAKESERKSVDRRYLRALLVTMVGAVFGVSGPTVRWILETHNSASASNFVDYIDAYLWPTHFLAWGKDPWGLISILANLVFFCAAAWGIYQTTARRDSYLVPFLMAGVWSILVTIFLAGFQFRGIDFPSALAGIVFYFAFVWVLIKISRIGEPPYNRNDPFDTSNRR
jgi:hypothetical protein